MASEIKVVLEGGPGELSGSIVSIETTGSDLKIPFHNGYEHFRETSRRADTAAGTLVVYEWWERTEMPA